MFGPVEGDKSPNDRPEEPSDLGALLASIAPGPRLADQLARADLGRIDGFALVELVAAAERLAGWAAAVQVDAIAELARRPLLPEGVGHPALSNDDDRVQNIEMDVGARLCLSPSTASNRVEVARRLAADLPGTLQSLRNGEIDYLRARILADEVGDLDTNALARVEERVLTKAGDRTHAQHRRAVRRAVMAVDSASTEQRHERAVEERRVIFEPLPDGMGRMIADLTADGLATLRGVLDAAAAAMKVDNIGDERTMAQRRADALVEMARTALATGHLGGQPDGQRLANAHGRRPVVQVTVPFSTLIGLDDEPAELAGYGPLPASAARRIAADGVWRRLLTDPATGALLDYGATTYSPPQDLTDFIIVRDRTCRGIGCARPARLCELDHTIPAPAGPTSPGNLCPLCKRHHQAKTARFWRLEQPEPGRFVWISSTRHVYEVEPEEVGPIVDPVPNGVPSNADAVANADLVSNADPRADTEPGAKADAVSITDPAECGTGPPTREVTRGLPPDDIWQPPWVADPTWLNDGPPRDEDCVSVLVPPWADHDIPPYDAWKTC